MTPAPSWCGTTRGKPMGREPARDFTSVGLRPEATTRTRTSPGPGSGASISPTFRTSAAGPFLSYHAAGIVLSSPALDRGGPLLEAIGPREGAHGSLRLSVMATIAARGRGRRRA